MDTFDVRGPYVIPVNTNGATKRNVDAACGRSFWAGLDGTRTAKRYGIYVFCMRAGRGYTPWYVGLAARQTFSGEVFSVGKLNQLNSMLHSAGRGTPVVFFARWDSERVPGKRVIAVIGEIEDRLIYVARSKNRKVLNKQKGHGPKWEIRGVLNHGPGKPSHDADELICALW